MFDLPFFPVRHLLQFLYEKKILQFKENVVVLLYVLIKEKKSPLP